MPSDPAAPPSTAGYAAQAAVLLERYEAYDPAHVNRWLVPHLPDPPADVLDIGAGTGRDAAWLARLGHRVVAVEPVAQMREGAQRLHSEPIEWIDDGLPALSGLARRTFDVVLLSAVWMHLDVDERNAGMARLASLVRPGGRLGMTLRHGPVPAGRRMYDVTDDETIALAAQHGLVCRPVTPSFLGGRGSQKPDVTFTPLVFAR